MKRRIYISLPISGGVNAARERADLIKAVFSKKGLAPVSPFDIWAGKDPAYEDYIVADLRAIASCSAVYFDEGWEKSPGCRIERAYVENLNAHRRSHEAGSPQIAIIEYQPIKTTEK